MADKKAVKRNNRNNSDDDFNPKFRKIRKKVCPLCGDKEFVLDYRNAEQLRKFINEKGKILPRRATGACSKHQRVITSAVKRARQIAVIPYAED
jgi:small subunit ribosomal protein S18